MPKIFSFMTVQYLFTWLILIYGLHSIGFMYIGNPNICLQWLVYTINEKKYTLVYAHLWNIQNDFWPYENIIFLFFVKQRLHEISLFEYIKCWCITYCLLYTYYIRSMTSVTSTQLSVNRNGLIWTPTSVGDIFSTL